jgi:glycosyltransferase involved in cell wall biosynthesis
LLADAVRSVFAADRPSGLDVRLVIVNNDTKSRLSSLDTLITSAPIPVLMLHEPRRGKSWALNLGIAASDADYIGLVDDDERLSATWFQVAYDALHDGQLDFIGGPMLPLWPATPPAWIPAHYRAVLGIVDNGPSRVRYSTDFGGMLVGGNAVIRRTLLQAIGGFTPELGPQAAHRLMSCEDEDVYERLLEAGAQGEYVPELVVHHHVHPDRMRHSYYRAWCFWNGVSKSVLRQRRPERVAAIRGVPRYLYGRAIRSAGTWLKSWLTPGDAASRFGAELPVWELTGHLYGRSGLHRLHNAKTADRQPGAVSASAKQP